jgi:hypothetical protein
MWHPKATETMAMHDERTEAYSRFEWLWHHSAEQPYSSVSIWYYQCGCAQSAALGPAAIA